ncbi:hypothetical protein GGR58DRAFT_201770 [Xylaria digitata]|nr:hypothetical protein GGR58DRAFT_201770 [Xylaria digitata]
MPDEEMDMSVDFGQAGFGDDIDIDLDFPAGQPDEDMDLGDFDRVHDIHNFNSDTRDELMAEGDDSSYGMIDAIDVDHNASAAAANDIEIELEQAVEGIWQQGPLQSPGFHPDTEIDYLDEATAESMDAEKNDVEASRWLPAETTQAADTDAMDHADRATIEILTGAQEAHEEPLLGDPAPSSEIASEPIKASHTEAETIHSPVTSDLKEGLGLSDIDDLPEYEKNERVSKTLDRPLIAGQDEHDVSQPSPKADTKPDSPNVELQESNKQQETSRFNDVIPAGSDHANDNEPLVSHNLEQLDYSEVAEPSLVKEDHADESGPEEAFESADDASEYQVGGESHIGTTNDQIAANNDAHQADSSLFGHSDSEPVEFGLAQSLESPENEEATALGMGTPTLRVSGRDDPIELADHYGIYISYGETDYQLFAKSDDDDPNQYFLTDKSTLDIPLTQFLTSLREVISEEISPLDDLVMEIDGLGLEFSESTTPDFLGKFTFGDLVVLYDKLVKNERAESSPPIYTYLTVKPNCNRRMMALGESANAGRGLTQVALYRDSPSMDEERIDDAGSPDTDFSTGGYNDGEGSIYPQEDYEEGDILSGDEQHDSPPITAEVQLGHVSNEEDGTDGLDNENEENSVDGTADAADREQDASISQHGICPLIFHYKFPCTRDGTCLCDDCYEVELQHLGAPTRAVIWQPFGTVMPTQNNPLHIHITSMTNHTMTEDHATSESSALQLQKASEHSEQHNPETPDINQLKPQAPKTTPTNPSTDVPNSENTSVTATLDGEDHDEINYDSDEDDKSTHDGINESEMQKKSSVITDLDATVDDEITWESDDDETKNETKGGSPTDAVQVSPASGKRSRADSDVLDDASDKNDYKRLRA